MATNSIVSTEKVEHKGTCKARIRTLRLFIRFCLRSMVHRYGEGGFRMKAIENTPQTDISKLYCLETQIYLLCLDSRNDRISKTDHFKQSKLTFRHT